MMVVVSGRGLVYSIIFEYIFLRILLKYCFMYVYALGSILKGSLC